MVHVVIGGHRVDLEPLVQTFVLRGTSAAIEALSAHPPAGSQVLATDPDAGVVVVETETQPIELGKLGRRLRVEPAYRQVGGPTDDLWAPTGRVATRFPEGWPRARVDEVLARRGLRVTAPIEDMPGGYSAITESDPIEAARALLEEDGALFAEPEFIQRMARRAAATGRRGGIGSRAVPGAAGAPRMGRAMPTGGRRR